ncbi:bifunctional AP-4-A phosphorylase/ADP sulfurylase [Cytospora paraplurivora]|uniref:Bifunctional AP-4-A phosphorylase/ADP sulfurylase n=1 Tax=Cytospora paraplurivora TaxID=2898453 RepID=A0AAN9YED6_9PEZI
MRHLPDNMGRSHFQAPGKLPELVKSRFINAKANGDIHFYPTQVTVLSPASVPFQLRFSPTLAIKPKGPPPSPNTGKPIDPFESPPLASRIGEVGDDHTLLLNKFAIVPEHFLVITNSFEKQTDLLQAGDLAATYACIKAYREEGLELFAFFNSGPHSGASQPHRHLQLLPVERMRDGLAEEQEGEWEGAAAGAGAGGRRPAGWDLLADRLAAAGDASEYGSSGSVLPFVTFSERLGKEMSPRSLRSVYLRLYRQACAAVEGRPIPPAKRPRVAAAGKGDEERSYSSEEEYEDEDEDGLETEARISYNIAMTHDAMIILPRLAEGDIIRDGEGKEVGRLALNGTVLAGTALVKSQAEWDALEGDGGAQLWEILEKIGVKPSK